MCKNYRGAASDADVKIFKLCIISASQVKSSTAQKCANGTVAEANTAHVLTDRKGEKGRERIVD